MNSAATESIRHSYCRGWPGGQVPSLASCGLGRPLSGRLSGCSSTLAVASLELPRIVLNYHSSVDCMGPMGLVSALERQLFIGRPVQWPLGQVVQLSIHWS